MENQPTKSGGKIPAVVSDALFEIFCDPCYYDLWAVRPVGEKQWGNCYHLLGKEEAEGLAKELTLLARIKNVAAMQWDASDQMDAIDDLFPRTLLLSRRARAQAQPNPNEKT